MTIFTPDNRLFVLARQAGRRPATLVAIALVPFMLALLIATQVVARRLLRPLLPGHVTSVADPIAEIIGFLSIYGGLWVWLRLSSGCALGSLGFERRGALRRAVGGALLGGGMVAATVSLIVVSGAAFAPGVWPSRGFATIGIGLFLLLVSAVQASAEEALFRGWLLQTTGARHGVWMGVLISSFVFSLAHAIGTGLAPLASLNLLLFGVFAAVYALFEGGLWGVSAWHAVWNWALGRLLGFPVSGAAVERGLLTSIRAAGREVISGGAFGPEGGLAATFVFLVAIAVLVVTGRRDRRGWARMATS